MLLSEIRLSFHQQLAPIYPPQEADSLFFWCAEHYLLCSRQQLHQQMNKNTSPEAEKKMLAALQRLQKNEPVQYILGETDFLDLKIKVGPGVLIPRPETEYLVHSILQEIPKYEPLHIADLCTGSGCMAIALAKHLPKAKVWGTDLSVTALQIAAENARQSKVTITWVPDDLLNSRFQPEKLDLIVSNPPYVRMLEKNSMHKNVLDYEPPEALFVDDGNPLIFYKAIARFALRFLLPAGFVYLEINEYLGAEMEALFTAQGFRQVELLKDLEGKTRFLKAMHP